MKITLAFKVIKVHDITDENTEYNKSLGFKITEKIKTLPIEYWIPKTHPTGS